MITILFGSFLIFVLLRIPVGFGMLLSCLIVIVLDGLPPMLVPLRVLAALFPFPIIAVPLFYIVGILCNSTSITERIMNLARALVGRVQAGLAMVNIVASMLFAGISGSSTADTAGIGSVIMPQMIKAGYSRPLTVAITACSSTLGAIIPPSIMMVIYGAFGSVSIGMLFLGGIIPGLIIGFGQMAMVYVLARRYDFGKNDFAGVEGSRFLPAITGGLAPLGVPVVIIGGIVGGVFTPTESASAAILYVLLLGFFVFRELNLKTLAGLLIEGGRFVGLLMIMTSAAAVFGWLLVYYKFPETVVGVFETFGAGRYGVLLAVVTVFLVLGTVLESIPAIIMLLPIIQALGDGAGIHPVQMGVIVVMTTALGMVTPPHGVLAPQKNPRVEADIGWIVGGLAAVGSMIRYASCVWELPDADHVSSLPAGPALASAAGLAGVGSPGSPRSPRQRRG